MFEFLTYLVNYIFGINNSNNVSLNSNNFIVEKKIKDEIYISLIIHLINRIIMSGSSAAANKLDASAVAAQLKEWLCELDDELELEKTLSQEAGALLEAAKKDLADTKDFVESQREERLSVLEELKKKIAENKEREAQMAEYHAFVTSPEYLEHCQKIRDIAALDAEIRDLLIKEERLGHPPVATKPECDCVDGCDEDCMCTDCDCSCCQAPGAVAVAEPTEAQ